MKKQDDLYSLKNLMEKVIEKNNLNKGLEKFAIQDAWKEVMGNGVDSYTQEINLTNGTLVVKLTSSVLREELSYGKEKILNMLNEALPKLVIEKIILV